MSGRKGKSGHQNLIEMASKKLLNEIIGDKYLSVVLQREQKLDVKANVSISGPRFGSSNIVNTEIKLFADIACAAVFAPGTQWLGSEPILPEFVEIAEKKKAEGKMDEYFEAVRSAYGVMSYIIECEINPRSNLLRDGPKLTAYKLLKQKNNNLVLILAVFKGTKVDNPEIFDHIWEFPRKTKRG
ncbi:hypothetical protein GH146_00945 [archaeon]|jgi:hypothetical protein|nr:hypothetical protein [archaeon]